MNPEKKMHTDEVDIASNLVGRLIVSQGPIALAYYTVETNPVLVREAQRWMAEVLADESTSPRRAEN